MDPGENQSTDQRASAPRDDSDDTESEPTTWYYAMDEPMVEDDDFHDMPEEAEDDGFYDAATDAAFQVVFGDPDDDEDGDDDYVEDDEEDDDDEGEDGDQATGTAQEESDAALRIMGLLRAGARSGLVTRGQLLAMLRDGQLGNILFDEDEEDDPEGFFGRWGRRRRRPAKDPNRFPKVPSEEGTKLMRSGAFGSSEDDTLPEKQYTPLARRMLERELGIGNREERRQNGDIITQKLIPGTRAEHIIHYDDPIYSGQFSDDGNFFFSVCQDYKVRMYDTSNPYDWKHYKTVSYPGGQWTLTDASLSPDNKWLAYTSIDSIVSMAPTDPNDRGDPYAHNLSDGTRAGNGWASRAGGFGIWSVRFSGDGRELVAGTNAAAIVVYDIESRTVLHHIDGHEDDVNAVCFADKSSPHIIYSGSDDTTIKVWDRRSMGDRREAGAFVGHIEGLTYIDSKGDGRYILSNGKDQSMKLWDLRMVMSTQRFRDLGGSRYAHSSGFDYRGETYDEEDWDVHPHDNSLVTFRGHKVLRTLIRCHFSPPSATNSRYVYSGSADGKVYIWNMDATSAGVIDVKAATNGTRRADRRTRLYFHEPGGWGTCVRDASWHPSAPVLVASAWNGYSMARGTCSLHSFNGAAEDEGEPQMGRSVDEMLQPNPHLYYHAEY